MQRKTHKICVHCKHFVRHYSMKDTITVITYNLVTSGHCDNPKGRWQNPISINKKGCEEWTLNTPRVSAHKNTKYKDSLENSIVAE